MEYAFVVSESDGELLAHDIHLKWADQINADIIKFKRPSFPGSQGILGDILSNYSMSKNDISKYDCFILEAPTAVYHLPLLEMLNPNSEKIFLHTTWRIFGLEAYGQNNWNSPQKHIYSLDRTIDKYTLRYLIDKYCTGVLTVSNLFKKNLSKWTDTECEIVKPYIKESKGISLQKISPNLSTNNGIVIAKNRHHKGIDLLVEAWKQASIEENKVGKLFVVGSGHKSVKNPNIDVMGFVENIEPVIVKSSFYIHPARVDAFPVSTLESMVSGLPTIVTTKTGTKELVEKVSSNLLTKPDMNCIKKDILEYIRNTKIEERKEYSNQFQKEGMKYIGDNNDFESKLYRLID